MYLLDGAVHHLREDLRHVDTPLSRANVIAKYMSNPLYDLVLWNIDRVRRAEDAYPEWHSERESEFLTGPKQEEAEVGTKNGVEGTNPKRDKIGVSGYP